MVGSMMNCEDALSRLWEYLDGELPGDESRALERHLEICRRCYPHYDFQKALRLYTREVAGREHAPPELRRKIFDSLLEEESAAGGGG